MKAVLLAGGDESLLNPLNKVSPKALLPIGNCSVAEYLIRLLKKNGIDEVLVSSGRSSESLKREIGEGARHGIRIGYHEEEFPRGPAGCLIPLKDRLRDGPFVVMSPVYPGDMDLGVLLARHRAGGAAITAAVSRSGNGPGGGFFQLDPKGRIQAYVETPFPGDEKDLYRPLGLYVFDPAVLDFVIPDTYMDIKEQLIPALLGEEREVAACLLAGGVNPLGNVREYFEANMSVFHHHNGIHCLGREISPGIFVAPGAKVSPGARLEGPLIIGEKAVIEEGACIRGPAVIGDRCSVERGGRVHESILWPGTRVGRSAVVERSISCRNAKVREGTKVSDALVNGKRLQIGEMALAERYFSPLKLNVHSRHESRLLGKINGILKRAMDFTAAVLGLALFSIPMLVIALIIKLDSPGPVFFVQTRRGKRGKKFKMIKFRSMVKDADKMVAEMHHKNQSDGPMFKIRKDPRLTRVGRIMRRTSLDEIPQLFNVLIGDMSLVGPRPLAMKEMKWSPRWRDIRLQVKPGITGMWQIKGRSNSHFHDWIELDIYYVRNQSFWLDLRILFETVKAVFQGEGAY